jgi:hypothetical protein
VNKIDLLNMLTKNAKEYRKHGTNLLIRNKHMNEITDLDVIDQKVIDAILVDFINFVGYFQGVDYALYTKDLKE